MQRRQIDLLHRAVSNGLRIFLALQNDAQASLLGDDVNALVAAGLQGLECYYGRYDDATLERLVGLANRYGLIPTGGSDYHGPNIHPTPLGGRYVPANAATLLQMAAERNRAEQAMPFTIAEAR